MKFIKVSMTVLPGREYTGQGGFRRAAPAYHFLQSFQNKIE